MRQRGKCPVCGYSVTIRRNGYAERHYIYSIGKHACPGGEEMRAPSDVPRAPLADFLKARTPGAEGEL